MKPLNILVIDDENVICNACALILSEKGHAVDCRTGGRAGLDAVASGPYDIMLLDIMLPDMNGLDVLKKIKQQQPDLYTIVMTGYATISSAVKAMRFGAGDYLAKPFTADELIASIEKAGLDG